MTPAAAGNNPLKGQDRAENLIGEFEEEEEQSKQHLSVPRRIAAADCKWTGAIVWWGGVFVFLDGRRCSLVQGLKQTALRAIDRGGTLDQPGTWWCRSW